MTAAERVLLEAVFDRAGDDAPRLAWAEWLTAQGNPWGEVVRSAVALAAKGKPPSRALRAAEFEHAASGVGLLAEVTSRVGATFERGVLTGAAFGAGIWDQDVLRYGGEPPYFARGGAGSSAGDPRWRGVEWLQNMAGDAVLPLLREARLERLSRLLNVSVRVAREAGELSLARQVRLLKVYAYDRDAKLLGASAIDGYSSLERLDLVDMLDRRSSDRDGSRVFGWLTDSKVACASLKRLGSLPLARIATVLGERARFRALEAVRFDSAEVTFAGEAAELYLYDFSAWAESQLKALRPGAIARIEVDARVLKKRKTGAAALKTLASALGAKLVVHAKPTASARHARW